jgi:predicted ester cyclase
MTDRDELLDLYGGYLEACNRHAWDELSPRLADTVLVNGVSISRAQYMANLNALQDVFPDCQWRLKRAVVEPPWLAVQLETSDPISRAGRSSRRPPRPDRPGSHGDWRRRPRSPSSRFSE